MPAPHTPRSPRLLALRDELASGDAGALARFWDEMDEAGTPLVESLPESDRVLITFLWREAEPLDSVIVSSPLGQKGLSSMAMSRLDDAGVWYRSYEAPRDLRASYQISPNPCAEPDNPAVCGRDPLAHRQPDPLNPVHLMLVADGSAADLSAMELPDAPPSPYVTYLPDVAPGRMGLHKVESKILGQSRRVWVYTPAGYSRRRGPYGLAILLDGWLYANALSAPTVLDNLIAQGRISPLVALLVDVGDAKQQQRELACDMPFAVHLAYELIPWAQERFLLAREPRRNLIGGAGWGGLAAAFCAWQWPDLLGNVLSQSGLFAWSPQRDAQEQWMARQYQRTEGLSLAFHLQVGSLEDVGEGTTTLAANRNLVEVLRLKEHRVSSIEFAGGHDPLCWRAGLADGLIALLGDGDA